jgi:hypothetical protein
MLMDYIFGDNEMLKQSIVFGLFITGKNRKVICWKSMDCSLI